VVETHPDQVHICPTCGRNYPGESWRCTWWRPILTRSTFAPPVAGTIQVRAGGARDGVQLLFVKLRRFLSFTLKRF
jgi:hypothetical protein